MRSAVKSLVVFAFLVFSAAFCSRSGAQTYSARCEVPFAFEMGNHHMDAGQYTITREQGRAFIQFRTTSDSSYALPIQDDDSVVSSGDKLVFARVGGQSYLREMRFANTSQFLKWPVSRAEKRQMLVQQTAPSTAVVALVRTQR